VHRVGEALEFRRGELVVRLQHWHYDVWTAEDPMLFGIHAQHPFDCASRLLFETDVDGDISALSIRLEPAAAPIQFARRRDGGS
jgi:hypothetical protein